MKIYFSACESLQFDIPYLSARRYVLSTRNGQIREKEYMNEEITSKTTGHSLGPTMLE
jgi:hypothetical protein